MAKQSKTANNANNVARVAALFSMLPVAIQELLRDADARDESLDFATIPMYEDVPQDAEFFYRTLEDFADPDEPVGPKMFRQIATVAEKEIAKANQSADKGAKAWQSKLKTWLGDNVGKMRVLTQHSNGKRLLTPYHDKQSCCLIHLGDDVKGRTNYREVVMILDANGEKQPVENMLRLDPVATAHLLNRILEVVRNVLDANGVKPSEKRNETIFAEPLIAELSDYLVANGCYGEVGEKRKARVAPSALPLK